MLIDYTITPGNMTTVTSYHFSRHHHTGFLGILVLESVLFPSFSFFLSFPDSPLHCLLRTVHPFSTRSFTLLHTHTLSHTPIHPTLPLLSSPTARLQ